MKTETLTCPTANRIRIRSWRISLPPFIILPRVRPWGHKETDAPLSTLYRRNIARFSITVTIMRLPDLHKKYRGVVMNLETGRKKMSPLCRYTRTCCKLPLNRECNMPSIFYREIGRDIYISAQEEETRKKITAWSERRPITSHKRS